MADLETNVANGAESTLSSTLSAGATTVNVTSTAAFPSVPFYAVIDPDVDASREIILVDSSKTATTFVLSGASKRGQDGTTDIEHSSGAKVVCVPVAALWTDINDRVDAAYTAGGADVAVADGGTGASTAATARTNLGVAADAEVVKLTGDQTVAGVKTFSSSPVIPAPTTDLQASTKKYVDDTVGGVPSVPDPATGTNGDVPTVSGGAYVLAAPASGGANSVFLDAASLHPELGSADVAEVGTTTWMARMLDASASETLSGVTFVPSGWSTVNIDVYWTNAGAGSGDVYWNAPRYASAGDGSTLAAGTTGTAGAVTAPAQNVVEVQRIFSGVSVTAGALLSIYVNRNGAIGGDTLANDVGVLGISIEKAS